MGKTKIGQRVALLIAYLGVGFLIVWLFGAGGHGTFFPIPILLSWAVVPAVLFGRLLGYVSLLFIPAYLTLVVYLNTIFSKVAESRVPYVTVTIHVLGAILGLIVMGSTVNRDVDSAWEIWGLFISVVFAFAYLELDWLLAGARIQPAPKGPYWDLGSS